MCAAVAFEYERDLVLAHGCGEAGLLFPWAGPAAAVAQRVRALEHRAACAGDCQGPERGVRSQRGRRHLTWERNIHPSCTKAKRTECSGSLAMASGRQCDERGQWSCIPRRRRRPGSSEGTARFQPDLTLRGWEGALKGRSFAGGMGVPPSVGLVVESGHSVTKISRWRVRPVGVVRQRTRICASVPRGSSARVAVAIGMTAGASKYIYTYLCECVVRISGRAFTDRAAGRS